MLWGPWARVELQKSCRTGETLRDPHTYVHVTAWNGYFLQRRLMVELEFFLEGRHV
jgi:hypothetical protein